MEKKLGRPASAYPSGVEKPNVFAEWLVKKEIGVNTAAGLFGVSTSTIYGWRRGTRPPSRRAAALIERVTDGAVSVSSWDGSR